jgi:hypothetical protein
MIVDCKVDLAQSHLPSRKEWSRARGNGRLDPEGQRRNLLRY